MAKLAQDFAKYVIKARMKAKGVVEKPDIIGAIFGQTEGLLGSDLDLRELQRTGRIGRIEVNVTTTRGTSESTILIPSSLDASETALIAASLETIEKVGPCDADIKVSRVEDVRSQKRRYVVDRAKEILKNLLEEGVPDSQKITEMIKQSVRAWEVSSYNGLSCGPNIRDYDDIIVVEGRADVINLIKNGIRNVIAIEGSKIPQPIINLTKEKITTAFLDGDRGGELDLKKLIELADIDFVAFAERGKEVEDLTKKQIYKALREKIPVDQVAEKLKSLNHTQYEPKPRYKNFTHRKEEKKEPSIDPNILSSFKGLSMKIIGTHAAFVLDEHMNMLTKVPLSELQSILQNYPKIHAIVIDGKVNQSLIDNLVQKHVKYLVCTGYQERVNKYGINVITTTDLHKMGN